MSKLKCIYQFIVLSLYFHIGKKEKKVFSVFILETLKVFLFNILTLDDDHLEGFQRP